MTIDQFLIHLDTFGANLNQWPGPVERKEARDFLLQSLDARQALESAQRLEALLIGDAQNSHKTPKHVLDAISNIAQTPVNNTNTTVQLTAHRPSPWMAKEYWPTAMAAAIPLIVSFAAGVGFGLQQSDLDDGSIEYADINSWVYADSLSESTIEFSAFFPAAEEGLDNDAT